MARRRFIQRDGVLYEVGVDIIPEQDEPVAPYVMPDIKPYKSMITGEMITSRSIHRAHLKQHNCIEIGNEKVFNAPPKAPPPPAETIRRELARRFGE